MTDHGTYELPVSLIRREVGSWDGVSVDGRGGGILFFRVGRREIGHVHGNRFADLPFPVRIREKLVSEGRANPHYLHPESGWVTCPIRSEEDVRSIIDLLRFNYERPWLVKLPDSRINPRS
jgi:hypothetical protein